MTSTIAACVISRNGAQTIERLIASVRPHVDEVCVYLAGESSDGTRQILDALSAEPGAPIRIRQGQWRNDYAEARNQSFDMASSDYLMWLDDDHVLEGGQHLRAMLDQADIDLLFMRSMDVAVLIDGIPATVKKGFAERVIRASLGARWRSPIHEYLAIPNTSRRAIARPDLVRLIHHPLDSPGRHRHRKLINDTAASTSDRRLRIYAAMYALRDDPNDETALEAFEDALSGPWAPDHYAFASEKYLLLSQLKRHVGDIDGAIAALVARIAIQHKHYSDPFYARVAAVDQVFPLSQDDPVYAMYVDDPRTYTMFSD